MEYWLNALLFYLVLLVVGVALKKPVTWLSLVKVIIWPIQLVLSLLGIAFMLLLTLIIGITAPIFKIVFGS